MDDEFSAFTASHTPGVFPAPASTSIEVRPHQGHSCLFVNGRMVACFPMRSTADIAAKNLRAALAE